MKPNNLDSFDCIQRPPTQGELPCILVKPSGRIYFTTRLRREFYLEKFVFLADATGLNIAIRQARPGERAYTVAPLGPEGERRFYMVFVPAFVEILRQRGVKPPASFYMQLDEAHNAWLGSLDNTPLAPGAAKRPQGIPAATLQELL